MSIRIHNVKHSIHIYVQLSLSIQFYLFGLKACALWHLRNENLLIAQRNQKANANKTILKRVCTQPCSGGKKATTSNILESCTVYQFHIRTHTYSHIHVRRHTCTHTLRIPTHTLTHHINRTPFSAYVKHSS